IVTGELADVLRLAQRIIDVAEGDPAKRNFIGLGSPLAAVLAARAVARCCLAVPGWREGFDRAVALPHRGESFLRAIVAFWKYGLAVSLGVVVANDNGLREIDETLQVAERSADDVALGIARTTAGLALVQRDFPADRERGVELLKQAGEMCRLGRYYRSDLPFIDTYTVWGTGRRDDDAVALMRAAVDDLFVNGQLPYSILTTGVLVERLLDRGTEGDVVEAEAAIERLAAAPADDGLVIRDISLLRRRALLARADGDDTAYRDYRDRYRAMAASLGFEGHLQWAEAMP